MKAVVLKTFRDRYTGVVYTPGSVLDIQRERLSDIRETLGDSYIAEIVDPEAAPAPEKPDNSSAPEPEDSGGTSEPEGGGETPATAAPAPKKPPKSKEEKKKE